MLDQGQVEMPLRTLMSIGGSTECMGLMPSYAQPLEAGLEHLAKVAGVQRVGLTGDHLRTISLGVEPDALRSALSQAGVTVQKIERGEPTLEDVFLSLAKD